MTDPDPNPPPGRELLREHLARLGLTAHAWCREHRIDSPYTTRVLAGTGGRRVSVDYASAIEAATNGEIPVSAWRSEGA